MQILLLTEDQIKCSLKEVDVGKFAKVPNIPNPHQLWVIAISFKAIGSQICAGSLKHPEEYFPYLHQFASARCFSGRHRGR